MAIPERHRARRAGLFLGPLLALGMLALELEPGNPAATRMAAVALWMAVWWITEAVPLFATSLLPLVLLPMLGILSGHETAPLYVNSTIFLFLGGFVIALVMERWGLHRRIALAIITTIGGGPSRVVLGFMVAAAGLSMWISNTATAIMMLPIALAILGRMEEDHGRDRIRPFAVAMLLGIAYACSIGGIATFVGTPPNLSFHRIYEQTFPEAPRIAFGQWMLLGVPIAVAMLAIVWLLLTRIVYRAPRDLTIDTQTLRHHRKALGRITREEQLVLLVFLTTALLWIFRAPLEIGSWKIPGWSDLLPFPGLIDDGTVAIAMALLLFVIPASRTSDVRGATEPGDPRPPRRLADADIVRALPWHIVLLFGGGFALAKGFQVSGLAQLIGEESRSLGSIAPWLMTVLLCLGVTFLTELTSNTATTEMILPVLAAVAVSIGVHPLALMVPATLSASCAFMMPVATPPNAIVFGSDRLHVADMARVGIWINLVGAIVIPLAFLALGEHLFDLGSVPVPSAVGQ